MVHASFSYCREKVIIVTERHEGYMPYENMNDAVRFVLATLEDLDGSDDKDYAELVETLESLDTSLKTAYDDLMANNTQGNDSPTVFNNFIHKSVMLSIKIPYMKRIRS